jgi:hypothetical protein
VAFETKISGKIGFEKLQARKDPGLKFTPCPCLAG